MPIRVTLEGGELTVAADAEGRAARSRWGSGDEVVELCPRNRQTVALGRSASYEYEPEGKR
jgi:hypothetical protein